MPYVSFISAPGCLAAAAGLVTPLRSSTVHLKTGQLLKSGVNQGYYQIKWDNPGYPGIALRLGKHLGLIFVQCWDKTSLQSPGPGTEGATAEKPQQARSSSHPSQTSRPLAAARLHQQSGVHIFAYWSYSNALHIKVYIFYAYTVTWTWKIYRQKRWCAAYFASHTDMTKIYIFSEIDLPRASHWNLKSLRLPDELACLRKLWQR